MGHSLLVFMSMFFGQQYSSYVVGDRGEPLMPTALVILWHVTCSAVRFGAGHPDLRWTPSARRDSVLQESVL